MLLCQSVVGLSGSVEFDDGLDCYFNSAATCVLAKHIRAEMLRLLRCHVKTSKSFPKFFILTYYEILLKSEGILLK